ncbi:MAG: chromosome segregation SMC family protein [archaeon]
MPYIKKLVMHGFKSFAKQTEIVFSNGLNTIVGPNGSGKSNVSDAICFVLGRLSMKSIRASKSTNLIYNGGSENKPAPEARVELHIDNSDKVFPAEGDVIITRVVRRDGQGIYKINNETKTREQVIDLLSQGGIDPYGFNIVLQGEISRFVQMHPEERRQIIEEIAGISVYETRKEKSLRELEKTKEELKIVGATLNERYAYLRNLDKERQQALKYKELENLIKKEKASLIAKDLKEKRGDKQRFEEDAQKEYSSLEKINKKIAETKTSLESINNEINQINKNIQESTGVAQETLHKEIAEGKADIAVLKVRLENYKQQFSDGEQRAVKIGNDIEQERVNITNFKAKIPEQERIETLLKEKRKAFDAIQNKHEKLFQLKTELAGININLKQNKEQHASTIKEMANIQPRISQLEEKIKGYEKEIKEIEKIKAKIAELENELIKNQDLHSKHSTSHAGANREIEILEKIKNDIIKLDVCPTCKRKVTEEDKNKVINRTQESVEELRKTLLQNENERSKAHALITKIKEEIDLLRKKHSDLNIARINFENLEEKRNSIKILEETRKRLEGEAEKFEKRGRDLELEVNQYAEIESQYQKTKSEIDELSTKENMNIRLEIVSKEKDIIRMQLIIKGIGKDKVDLQQSIKIIETDLKEKEKAMAERDKKEKEMYAHFHKLFEKRNSLQDKSRQIELELVNTQNDSRGVNDGINIKRIALAKIDAEISSFETEFLNFGEVVIIEASKNELAERLKKHEFQIDEIGSVNMRALQVYEDIKREYDIIQEKAMKLDSEKEEILKIVEEIDKRKRVVFVKTLSMINDYFSQNYLKLVGKGQAFLELENQDNPFEGGLEITVKLAKGKYADITALSGGEQVLTALSLIFSIQEFKPYAFYIFDEIDAALDKRNSERLAASLKDYIRTGQYLVITHNDAVIGEATTLYGVTMQDGISRVLSLRI